MELSKQLLEALANEGITAEEITVIKNGCECTGVKVISGTDKVYPIVYYSQDENLAEIVRRVKTVAGQDKPKVDVSQVIKPDYARKHASLAIRKISGEDLVKQNILNLEAYVRVAVDMGNDTGYLKADKTYLQATDLTEAELWEAAVRNTRQTLKIYSMAELLELPEELMEELRDETSVPFYVCTTTDRTNGATALYFPDIFKEFCETHGLVSLWLIPSSTEEVLINQQMDLEPEVLAMMIEDINIATVDPLIQLDPVVYKYDLKTNAITIAADARQLKVSVEGQQ